MVNSRNIKLVRFSSGGYGVRKGWFCKQYYDFAGGGSIDWRGKHDMYFSDCKVDDYERAEKLYKELACDDEVVK